LRPDGVLHVGVTQAVYEPYIYDASKKREANVKGWYEVGRVAGISVDVYFGRVVHGKHAVDASGICIQLCMMRI